MRRCSVCGADTVMRPEQDRFCSERCVGYAAGLEAGRLRAALEDKYENTKAIANMVKDSEAACHRIVRAIRRRAGLEP